MNGLPDFSGGFTRFHTGNNYCHIFKHTLKNSWARHGRDKTGKAQRSDSSLFHLFAPVKTRLLGFC